MMCQRTCTELAPSILAASSSSRGTPRKNVVSTTVANATPPATSSVISPSSVFNSPSARNMTKSGTRMTSLGIMNGTRIASPSTAGNGNLRRAKPKAAGTAKSNMRLTETAVTYAEFKNACPSCPCTQACAMFSKCAGFGRLQGAEIQIPTGFETTRQCPDDGIRPDQKQAYQQSVQQNLPARIVAHESTHPEILSRFAFARLRSVTVKSNVNSATRANRIKASDCAYPARWKRNA